MQLQALIVGLHATALTTMDCCLLDGYWAAGFLPAQSLRGTSYIIC